MRCTSCGFANLEGTKFCIECGSPLANRCPRCEHENLPRAKFCGECGASLTAKVQDPKAQVQSPESQSGPTERAASAGERRQLTVMFCDLVGSTALSAQLDPEELREVVRAYQEMCAGIIHRYEGYIAQYLGDGLLVYFGYPAAHEDDARRAVRAGLEIVGALREAPLQSVRRQQPVQVRIGIHTGLVVIGEIGSGGRSEQLALGETPNIAARIQGLAEPDAVVISAATQRLIADYFACQSLGPQNLKGLPQSLEVYRVLGESDMQNRLEVVSQTGLTPLVGRDEEVGLLLKRWEQTKEGRGQVVLLSGEPGIGKSRLAQTLKERVASEGSLRLEAHCSPYHQNSAFYPVIDFLQRALQFQRVDSPEEKLHKLEVGAHSRAPLQSEAISLFASLLSLPLPERYPPLTLTPQKQREKTLQALLSWLLQAAERQPVLSVWEDLHWADPSTLELITLLLEQAPTARLLILLTCRPEFTPAWAFRSHFTQITLSRLSRTQVEAMVGQITGSTALPIEVVQQIVSKTDGVPLFVEELTKTVLESGLHVGATHASPLPLAIPATLQDALMARLDRLGTAKEVAQLGATLGREFSYELLQAVSPLDEEALQRELGRLVEAELLYQQGLLPQARYVFKHALIQDTAYQSLLKSRRQQLHQQVARMLEERFPQTVGTQSELLAHHYTEAGLVSQAIPYWQNAGQRAIDRSANEEAISHLSKGLELLKTLPDIPERTQQELMLQFALGAPLIATKGHAALEVEQTYRRARELCRQVGETPQLFRALAGLWVFYHMRAELETARELGEQLLTLAQRAQDPALLAEAHRALGATLGFLGEMVPGRAHLEQAVALHDSQPHRSLTLFYEDPRVSGLSHLARVLWVLGYPEQAVKRSREALTLARELDHPGSMALALTFAAWVYQFRQEGQTTQEQAKALIDLSTEHELMFYLSNGFLFLGGALAEQGQVEEGVAQIRHAMTTWQTTGTELNRSYILALLAKACGKTARVEEGLMLLAEALAMVGKTGGRWWEAELYRLRGELTLQKFQVSGSKFQVTNPQSPTPNPQAEAEACFHKAIEIACQQSAKSLELRAVMSLSRLWLSQGKKVEAQQMLAEIYGWFTEGFDTADLKEAKALLEELAH